MRPESNFQGNLLRRRCNTILTMPRKVFFISFLGRSFMQFLWPRNFGWRANKKYTKWYSSDEYCWARPRDSDNSIFTTQEHEEIDPTPLQLKLPNGSTVDIFVQQNRRRRCKKLNLTVKHYGHTVLQLGLLYLEFLDIINIPQTYRWNISSGELRSFFFRQRGQISWKDQL